MSKLSTLTQEEMDNVIYDARFGDLESLKEIFTTEVEVSVLPKIQDETTFATPVHMASANGHADVVRYLLSLLSEEEAVKLVNKQNDSGNTALHWAAYQGHIDVIEILCEYKADPFLQNKAGHDSIFEAENNGQDEVETYFLKRFSVDLEDPEETDEVTYKPGTEIQKSQEESKDAMAELEKKTEDLEV